MISTLNNEYGFENEKNVPIKKKIYIVLATRIKLLLDAGLLSIYQHHIDNN